MKHYFNRLRGLKIHIPMKNFLWVLLIMLNILSCTDTTKINPDIAATEIDFELARFDVALANATIEGIAGLKSEFPYFFSGRFNETYWEAKMKDTLQKEIESQVDSVFREIDDLTLDLETLFKHIHYYFPETTIPKTVTVATDVDYRNKVILADSLLFVSMATYLGEDHYFYNGIARFHTKNFRKEQIVVDVAHAFAKAQTPPPQSTQFIEQIVYEGKLLYLMKQFLSETPEHEVFSYTEDELNFALENEMNIWEYFVSKELLFSTDRKLSSRFIDPAPFSKFYLDLDNETPGRIGRYIGYKIVASYMTTNNVPLRTLLIQEGTTLFNNSKYKP